MARTCEHFAKGEIGQLVQEAVATECNLAARGLYFSVNEVDLRGNPLERIVVWATLHFLPTGSPFCCGEPGCHLCLWDERLEAVQLRVRRALNLQNPLSIDFGNRINVYYHDGVEFFMDREIQ
jgi:hypothetical protein